MYVSSASSWRVATISAVVTSLCPRKLGLQLVLVHTIICLLSFKCHEYAVLSCLFASDACRRVGQSRTVISLTSPLPTLLVNPARLAGSSPGRVLCARSPRKSKMVYDTNPRRLSQLPVPVASSHPDARGVLARAFPRGELGDFRWGYRPGVFTREDRWVSRGCSRRSGC